MKKIVCVLLACTMLITGNTLFFAAEPIQESVAIKCDEQLPENTRVGNYFEFIDGRERISSDGLFNFSYSFYLDSTTFLPAASTIYLSIKATCTEGTPDFYVSLYELDTDKMIKRIKFTANGVSQSGTFSSLDATSTRYYLKFERAEIFWSGTITGSGKLYPLK